MTVPHKSLTKNECETLKIKAIVEQVVHKYPWGTTGPELNHPLQYKLLSMLDTDHLENIIISQSLNPAVRAAILMLLKRRYLEACGIGPVVHDTDNPCEKGGPWTDLPDGHKQAIEALAPKLPWQQIVELAKKGGLLDLLDAYDISPQSEKNNMQAISEDEEHKRRKAWRTPLSKPELEDDPFGEIM